MIFDGVVKTKCCYFFLIPRVGGNLVILARSRSKSALISRLRGNDGTARFL